MMFGNGVNINVELRLKISRRLRIIKIEVKDDWD